jgi:tetratricopeptide (TPR) repeat protein
MTTPPPNTNPSYDELVKMAHRGEHAKALPEAKRLYDAEPLNIAYARLYALCCRVTGRKSKSSSVLRRVYHSVAFDAELAYDFGESLLESQHDQEAIAILSGGLHTLSESDQTLRSRWLTLLGSAFWAVNHRDQAVQSWENALKHDPANKVATHALKEHTNAYGEPKSPTPLFDDMYHFQRLHLKRFVEEQGQDQSDMSETQLSSAIDRITAAWSRLMDDHFDTFDAMSPAEKSALFASVTIEFTDNPGTPIYSLPTLHADTAGEADEAILSDGWPSELDSELRNRLPFLNDAQLEAIPYIAPLLISLGADPERFIAMLQGTRSIDPAARQDFIWATNAVVPLLRGTKGDERSEIASACMGFETARQRLAFEDAVDAITDVHDQLLYGEFPEDEYDAGDATPLLPALNSSLLADLRRVTDTILDSRKMKSFFAKSNLSWQAELAGCLRPFIDQPQQVQALEIAHLLSINSWLILLAWHLELNGFVKEARKVRSQWAEITQPAHMLGEQLVSVAREGDAEGFEDMRLAYEPRFYDDTVALSAIARGYLLLNQPDLAEDYFESGLDHAQDDGEEQMCAGDYSQFLRAEGRIDEAIQLEEEYDLALEEHSTGDIGGIRPPWEPEEPMEPLRVDPKPERNKPCPCGSGKKYKNCHGKGE